MKKWKTYLALASSVLLLAASLLTGCSSQSSPNEKTAQTSTEPSSPPEKKQPEPSQPKSGFPEKPINLISWSSAGSPGDIYCRQIAKALEKELGTTIVVKNMKGAGGAVAIANILSQPADGYTIGQSTQSMVVGFDTGKFPDFKPDDLVYLSRVQQDPYLIAVPKDAPYNTLNELIDYAKKNPGKFKMGGFSIGSSPHLSFVETTKLTGIKMEYVPYEGAADAVVAMLGNHVNGVYTNPSVILSQIKSGDVKVLAVTSDDRLSILPDTPTLKELGFDYSGGQWRGLLAKKGTPPEIIKAYEEAIKKATQDPDFQAYLDQTATTVALMDSQQFTASVHKEIDSLGKVLEELGMKK